MLTLATCLPTAVTDTIPWIGMQAGHHGRVGFRSGFGRSPCRGGQCSQEGVAV